MSSGQNGQDSSQDLAQQLEEWARLNDGVSFGDPTTVALCRAAAAMLKGDDQDRRQPSPQSEAEARAIAKAILDQRAKLDQLPEAEDAIDATAPSPVPLARRQMLTMETVEDDQIAQSPTVSRPSRSPAPPAETEPSAMLEAAEDLEPDDEIDAATTGDDEDDDESIPWFALPDDDNDPADENPASRLDTDLTDDPATWHDDDASSLNPVGWEEEDEDDKSQGVAPSWSDRPMPDEPEFDPGLVPAGDRRSGRDRRYHGDGTVSEPAENRIAAPPGRSAASFQAVAGPGSLFPPPGRAGVSEPTEPYAEPMRLKPSLEDEIARLVALLDQASTPAPPPSTPTMAPASLPSVAVPAGTAATAPRVSRMVLAAAGQRPGPSTMNTMALPMYRKPLREELEVFLDDLRIFNTG